MNFGRGGFFGGEEDHMGVSGNNRDKAVVDHFSSSTSSTSSSSSSHQAHQLQLIPITQIHQTISPRSSEEETQQDPARNATTSSNSNNIEKEHMFEKVVTPSDVGKLNRLVIPKQHAEKYFPLDPSSNEKGLILNFEDRTGKSWRFRYSYWNSSQSYVMTKGWSRFVKEKKLDAGEIVSFHRGATESNRHRLFIDWKRRPTMTDLPLHHFPFTANPWNIILPNPSFNPQINTFNHQGNVVSRAGASVIYLSPQANQQHHQEVGVGTVVYDSVPVVQGKAAAKRLRLFGVNMDCPIPDSDLHETSSSLTTTTRDTTALSNPNMVPLPMHFSLSSHHHRPSHLRLYNGTPVSQPHDFLNKGKSSSSSTSFDM